MFQVIKHWVLSYTHASLDWLDFESIWFFFSPLCCCWKSLSNAQTSESPRKDRNLQKNVKWSVYGVVFFFSSAFHSFLYDRWWISWLTFFFFVRLLQLVECNECANCIAHSIDSNSISTIYFVSSNLFHLWFNKCSAHCMHKHNQIDTCQILKMVPFVCECAWIYSKYCNPSPCVWWIKCYEQFSDAWRCRK